MHKIKIFLSSLPIIQAMLLVAALPSLLALGLGGWMIAGSMQELRGYDRLATAVALDLALSEFLHEQQKERGQTAVYLTTKENADIAPLVAQRKASDARFAELQAHISAFEAVVNNARIQETLAELAERQAAVAEVRAQVDAKSVKTADALGVYTTANTSLMKLFFQTARLSPDGDIGNEITSATSLLKGKERVGIERAVGSAGFGLGFFDAALTGRMNTLGIEQRLLYESYRQGASADALAAFDEFDSSAVVQTVEKMRQIALTQGSFGALGGITAKDFFDAMTQKIDGLKEIERLALEDINSQVMARQQAQRNLGITSAAAVLVALILSFLASYMISRSIKQQISTTVGLADTMAEGNMDVEMPDAMDNEVGSLVTSLGVLQSSILEAREVEARHAAEEKERMRQEQEADEAARAAEKEALAKEQAAREAELAHERAMAREIAEVVGACARGDFSQRVDMDGKTGIWSELCSGVNEIGQIADAGLKDVQVAMRQLADGKLSYRMDGKYQGVFADIQDVLNSSIETIAKTVMAIQSSSNSLRDATTSIGAAAGDLAQRTESNAATLEETTSALSELADAVRVAAQAADEARAQALGVKSQAAKGNDVVNDTVTAMQGIKESAASITKIIDVIDNIAFQTNLLALNAGVEAARAGEAGRGFAVVATEVRELAARSSDAAQEISELINQSSRRVDDGVELVDQSGEALSAIAVSVEDISERIENIAASSNEQSTGIKEITSASGLLDSSTQENAAMFEETSAAISAMQEELIVLISAVDAFDLGDQPVTHRDGLAQESVVENAPEAEPAAMDASDEVFLPEPRQRASGDWDEF